MLNSIQLTNFQRHRNLKIDFTGGINALRGSNEAGKSTLLRGICYALFGLKAMSVGLADLVTWGEPENSLKVELTLAVDGATYTIKRGKSGAEVNYDGGIVTGQSECTTFLSKLLKADAGAAARLVLANQGEIRGAIESGTKETTELMERLAEFDQIDRLIELMQEKLVLGNPANAEASVQAAQAALDAARGEATEPNHPELDRIVGVARSNLEQADAQLASADTAVDEAQQALGALQGQRAQAAAAQQAVSSAQGRVSRAKAAIEEALAIPAPTPFDVEGARDRIAALGNVANLRAVFQQCEPLLGAPARPADDRFEGGFSDLAAELSSTQGRLDRARRAAAEAKAAAGQARAAAEIARSKVSTGNCATCGQPVDHLPEVAERNKTFTAEAERQEAAAAAHDQGHAKHLQVEAELLSYLQALQAVQKESEPRQRLLARFPDHLSDDGMSPPTLTWTGGGIPDDASAEVTALRQQISAHEAAQRTYDAAQAGLARAQQEQQAANAELDAALTAAQGVQEVPAGAEDSARAALDDARRQRTELQAAARDAQRALGTAEQARAAAIEAHRRAMRAIEDGEAELARRRAELKDLAFNNALLKAVRAARPVLADKLWNLVLAAVSRYFSEMRGIASKVTKDADGFKVDGHTASTLSGSTLDILGLAVRVALTRTFLPTAPFLVLDEPAAAMDEQRTNQMLGFLASTGFPQTLLVTHEDISESVASNLIEVGP